MGAGHHLNSYVRLARGVTVTAWMASVLTTKSRFLHVPKTGGTWATEAMIAAGVPCSALRPPVVDDYAPFGHSGLEGTVEHRDAFTIAFVRHPLDWWRSFWSHRMREGWLFPDHEIDSRAQSPDFDAFIALVVERLPGLLGEMYSRFVGPPGQPIEFIGHYERLVDDLCLGLRLAGESFDEAVLRAHPPRNVGDYVRFPARYDRALARELADAEAGVIERFYPMDPVPERMLSSSRMGIVNGTRRAAAPGTSESQRISRLLLVVEARLRHTELALENARAENQTLRLDIQAATARNLADLAEARLCSERAHLDAAEARQALELLRGSRLMRITRPLRLGYYGLRRRIGLMTRGKRAQPAEISEAGRGQHR
jgi:hypothetical protein